MALNRILTVNFITAKRLCNELNYDTKIIPGIFPGVIFYGMGNGQSWIIYNKVPHEKTGAPLALLELRLKSGLPW